MTRAIPCNSPFLSPFLLPFTLLYSLEELTSPLAKFNSRSSEDFRFRKSAQCLPSPVTLGVYHIPGFLSSCDSIHDYINERDYKPYVTHKHSKAQYMVLKIELEYRRRSDSNDTALSTHGGYLTVVTRACT